jgi:Pregnancy-associated plasma protein-A.
MNKLISAAILSAGITIAGTANAQHKCALDEVMAQAAAGNPAITEAILQAKQKNIEASQAYIQQQAEGVQMKTTADLRIPVVFHVILTQDQIDAIKGTDGISRRVGTQLDALNRDYNTRNPDLVNVPPVFQSVIGKMNISFALAHTAPDGSATSGIEVKVAGSTQESFPVFPAAKERSTANGGLEPWDTYKYLNVWVVNLQGGGGGGEILGVAYSPLYAGALGIPNGVTLNYRAFGQKIGTNYGSFITGIDSGRTMVHELGHFFGLDHIWGGSTVSCSDDDGIDDTPLQETENYDCPSFPKANCTNSNGGEMFMNYMDYVKDKCMMMFTKQQVARMAQEFEPSVTPNSYELGRHPELTEWPTSVADINEITEIMVTPNPSSGRFSVTLGNNSNQLKDFTVLNTVGAVVKTIPAAGNTYAYNINLDGMPKGMYILQCRFEERIVTRKIILQ